MRFSPTQSGLNKRMNPTLQRSLKKIPCPWYGPYTGTPQDADDAYEEGEETDYSQDCYEDSGTFTADQCYPEDVEEEEEYELDNYDSEVPQTEQGDYCEEEYTDDPEYFEEDEPCPAPCPEVADYECPLPGPCMPCPCPAEEPLDEPETGFTNHGANSICGAALMKVNEIIKNITPHTVLDEFMLSIASYTGDKGEAMFDMMSNEVNNFKDLIKEIYANRNDTVSDLLKSEQRQLKNKYDKMAKDFYMKSEEALEKIQERVPGFDFKVYSADPKDYIYNLMVENIKKQHATEFSESNKMTSERNIRVGMHKRTWLMRESERIECDNEERRAKMNEMMTQLACLSEGLATSNKKLAAYNRQLESHATCLRNKLAYNETLMGCLMDELDTVKAETKTDCPLIEPDEILTPFLCGYDYC